MIPGHRSAADDIDTRPVPPQPLDFVQGARFELADTAVPERQEGRAFDHQQLFASPETAGDETHAEFRVPTVGAVTLSPDRP